MKRNFFIIFTLTILVYILLIEPKNDLPFEQSNDKCDQEWERIGSEYYFKRSAAYYFIDENLLVLNYLTYASSNSDLKLILTIHLSDNVIFEKIVLFNNDKLRVLNNYKAILLTAHFDPKTYSQIKYKNPNIYLIIQDLISLETTKNLINIKIKRLNLNEKKGVYLCSKCLFNYNDMNGLKFWIEANKRTGYDKISICNHTSHGLDRLFETYKYFINIQKLTCLPNLINNSSKYFDSFNELDFLDSKNSVNIYDMISEIVLNECYYDNMDKYEHISILDVDELIIPKSHTQFSARSYARNSKQILDSSIQVECIRKNLTSYFKNFKAQKSIYFKNGMFIKNYLVHKIVLALEKVNHFPIEISILDDDPSELKHHKSFNYNITISNKFEYEYAIQLVKVYKKVIRPYLAQNETLIKRLGIMSRFYVISGSVLDFLQGKTVHDTNRSFRVHLHESIRQFKDGKVYDYIDSFRVEYDYGEVSHFRNFMYHQLNKIPISQIQLDLNFFNCIYKPILNEYF